MSIYCVDHFSYLVTRASPHLPAPHCYGAFFIHSPNCRNDSLSVLPVVLPLLQERLMHSDVLVRETGIVAIGAIAECQGVMGEHLKHIFP